MLFHMFLVFLIVVAYVRIERHSNNYMIKSYFNGWIPLCYIDGVTTFCCVETEKGRNCMRQHRLRKLTNGNIVFSTGDYLDKDVCVVYHRVKNNNYDSVNVSIAERVDVQIGNISDMVVGSYTRKTQKNDGFIVGPEQERFLYRFRNHPHLINASTLYIGYWDKKGEKIWEEGGDGEIDVDAELCWSWQNVTIGPYQEVNLSYIIYPFLSTLPLVLNISNDVLFNPDLKSLTINGRAFDPNGDFQPGMKLMMSVNGDGFRTVKDSFAYGENEFQITINMPNHPGFQIEEYKNKTSLVFYLEAPSRKNSRRENITLFFQSYTMTTTNSISDKSLYWASNNINCANKRLNCSTKCSNCTNCNKQINCPSTCPRCTICPKCKNDMLEDADQEITEVAKRYYKKYTSGKFEEEFRKNYENTDIDYEKGMYFIPIIET